MRQEKLFHCSISRVSRGSDELDVFISRGSDELGNALISRGSDELGNALINSAS